MAGFSQPTTLETTKIFKDPSSYRNVWTHMPEVISDIPPKPFKIDRRTVTYDHKRILRQLIDTLAKLVFFVQLKVDRIDTERLLPKKIIVQVFKELPEKLPTGHYLKKKPCRDEYECLWAGDKGLPHQVLYNIGIQIFNKSALESKGKVNWPKEDATEEQLHATWSQHFDLGRVNLLFSQLAGVVDFREILTRNDNFERNRTVRVWLFKWFSFVMKEIWEKKKEEKRLRLTLRLEMDIALDEDNAALEERVKEEIKPFWKQRSSDWIERLLKESKQERAGLNIQKIPLSERFGQEVRPTKQGPKGSKISEPAAMWNAEYLLYMVEQNAWSNGEWDSSED
jgi:hypothetical protein